MFSVVIPLYNKELSISNTIQSVLDQTFQDFEIVIVNDGSTDGSVEMVEKFDDKRIRLIHQENQGVSAARNKGIKEAKYDLIAFLDGDDWWDKDFLKTMINLSHKYPEAGLYGGQYVQINRKYEIIKLDRFPPIKEGYFKLHDFLYAIWSSSIIIRKNVFNVSGDFDEDLTHGEDTDMWVRIALKHKICYTSKIIAYYNIAGNPLTKSTGRIPAFKQHFLSKIDNYIGQGGKIFDSRLMSRKITYLRTLYIQYPFDPNIKKMIKSLPDSELNKQENKIFTAPFLVVYSKHVLLVARQNLIKARNLIALKFKKIQL